jgi:hypothetical protein
MEKGDTVWVMTDQVFFGHWKPKGLGGTVAMLDKDGGVCVEILVSPAFKPHFWFPETELAFNKQLALPSLGVLEGTFIGGRKAGMNLSPIRMGLLRSWLLIKLRVMPTQPLYSVITEGVSESDLMAMYEDPSDAVFERWAKQYDTRPKRALIDADTEVSTISPTVRRPRLV